VCLLQEGKIVGHREWTVGDFECLARSLPSLDSATMDDTLVLVDSQMDAELCFIFMNPKLVKETAKRIANWKWLKVCADGTFRMVAGKYVVVSCGLLSKQFVRQANPGQSQEGYTFFLFILLFQLTVTNTSRL
jgi:hypothetical protein